MSLYTERHGMRTPIEKTTTITVEMYSILLSCCEKYYDNLAHLFPEQCSDGMGYCGLNNFDFQNMLLFEIPTLFRNSNSQIIVPQKNAWQDDEFDQYALLDFLEYIGQNCRDISVGSFHSYFGHNHITLLETEDVFETYRNEINNIFKKTGLLFTLTEEKIVERIVENSALNAEIEETVRKISEVGTKELFEKAIILFKQPHPSARKDAVEKLWDAFERLKTYYGAGKQKSISAEKIVSDMSNANPAFIKLFDDEFRALTDIGNNYRIRHHETNKIDIDDPNHFDYFFNRCLSLIALAIKYLN